MDVLSGGEKQRILGMHSVVVWCFLNWVMLYRIALLLTGCINQPQL